MGGYLIIVCDKCKKQSIALEGQKTRLCPYCGNSIKVSMTKVIAKAESIEHARQILIEEKEARSSSRELGRLFKRYR